MIPKIWLPIKAIVFFPSSFFSRKSFIQSETGIPNARIRDSLYNKYLFGEVVSDIIISTRATEAENSMVSGNLFRLECRPIKSFLV